MSHWGLQITSRNLENRLPVELICKDVDSVLLECVTRYLFLQLALHTVSILKGNDKNGMSDVSGTWKVRIFLIALVFKVQLRHCVQMEASGVLPE